MNEATFTFRVDQQLKNQFASAAKARDRTGAQLLRDFMRDFIGRDDASESHDVWFRRQVETGQASADAGHMMTAQDVEARFAARRVATARKNDDEQ